MPMTTAQLVSYLRLNVNIGTTDSEYLKMTDEELILFLNVALTRDFPEVESLDVLPSGDVYPLILLAKKELFYSLASRDALLYDLGADNNNYLKRSQRFDHYMKLIAQADDEYEKYLENGGLNNTLSSCDVRLSDRYYTRYNIEHGIIPNVTLRVDRITDTTVELSWNARMERFHSFNVYISSNPIVDIYSLKSKISDDSMKVATITDSHQNRCRIEGLTPNTSYYVAVSAVEMSGITGYRQIEIITAEATE